MKKVFLLATALVFTSVILAQIEQGKFVLSGATGLQFVSSNMEFEYDGQSQGDFDQSSFSLMPLIGYFVMDNFAVGLSVNYSSTTQKDLGEKIISKSTLIFPTAIYYFPVEGDVKPLIEVGAGHMSYSEKYVSNSSPSEKEEFSGLAYYFGGGFSYFMNDHVSLNFGLARTIANLKNNSDSDLVLKQGQFVANIGFSIFL